MMTNTQESVTTTSTTKLLTGDTLVPRTMVITNSSINDITDDGIAVTAAATNDTSTGLTAISTISKREEIALESLIKLSHLDMYSIINRFKTFDSYYYDYNMQQDQLNHQLHQYDFFYNLAKNGFYSCNDMIICAYCHICIKNWKCDSFHSDYYHLKYTPNCPFFVKLKKSAIEVTSSQQPSQPPPQSSFFDNTSLELEQLFASVQPPTPLSPISQVDNQQFYNSSSSNSIYHNQQQLQHLTQQQQQQQQCKQISFIQSSSSLSLLPSVITPTMESTILFSTSPPQPPLSQQLKASMSTTDQQRIARIQRQFILKKFKQSSIEKRKRLIHWANEILTLIKDNPYYSKYENFHQQKCQQYHHHQLNSTSTLLPYHSYYTDKDRRVNSFSNWKMSALKCEQIATAGFFSTTNSTFDYTATCFYCNITIYNWRELDRCNNDAEWENHVIYSPKCLFLLAQKGSAYVNYVLEKRNLISH